MSWNSLHEMPIFRRHFYCSLAEIVPNITVSHWKCQPQNDFYKGLHRVAFHCQKLRFALEITEHDKIISSSKIAASTAITSAWFSSSSTTKTDVVTKKMKAGNATQRSDRMVRHIYPVAPRCYAPGLHDRAPKDVSSTTSMLSSFTVLQFYKPLRGLLLHASSQHLRR